jgi:hypothetical protein
MAVDCTDIIAAAFLDVTEIIPGRGMVRLLYQGSMIGPYSMSLLAYCPQGDGKVGAKHYIPRVQNQRPKSVVNGLVRAITL